MTIRRVRCGVYASNSYLLYDEARPDALMIDAGDDLPGLLKQIGEAGKRLTAILLTHGHFDHVLAAGRLRKATGAEVLIGWRDGDCLLDPKLSAMMPGSTLAFEPCRADRLIHAGAVTLAGLGFTVIETPGHTPGGLCFLEESSRSLFTGDTLFAQGYGRLDLPGGNAGEMRQSLQKLLDLPDDLTVYPGHGMRENLGQIKEAWGI